MNGFSMLSRIEIAPRREKRDWKGIQAESACATATPKRPLSRPKVSHVVAQTHSAFSLRRVFVGGSPTGIRDTRYCRLDLKQRAGRRRQHPESNGYRVRVAPSGKRLRNLVQSRAG